MCGNTVGRAELCGCVYIYVYMWWWKALHYIEARYPVGLTGREKVFFLPLFLLVVLVLSLLHFYPVLFALLRNWRLIFFLLSFTRAFVPYFGKLWDQCTYVLKSLALFVARLCYLLLLDLMRAFPFWLLVDLYIFSGLSRKLETWCHIFFRSVGSKSMVCLVSLNFSHHIIFSLICEVTVLSFVSARKLIILSMFFLVFSFSYLSVIFPIFLFLSEPCGLKICLYNMLIFVCWILNYQNFSIDISF